MPRKPRTHGILGIYHIVLRSVNQQLIFQEEVDYQKFLFLLSDCKEKYDAEIYAYCLMSNHIHLLIKFTDKDNIANFFQSFGSRFVRWYNIKYHRSGHLFQERFYSNPINSSQYYLEALIYIHNNPVAAGICRAPSEYHWSSHNAFYGEKNPLVNLTHSYEVAGSKDLLLHFFSLHSDNINSTTKNIGYEGSRLERLSDEDALKQFQEIKKNMSIFDIQTLPKTQRNEVIRMMKKQGFTQTQISRIFELSTRSVRKVCAESSA